MSVINTSKTRLMIELGVEFPRMRNLSETADVLLAGERLGAINESNKHTKWEFLKSGANDNAFYPAFKKYHLLTKKETDRTVYFFYERRGRLDNEHQMYSALLRERRGLYVHLSISSEARTAVATILSLPNNNLVLIRRALESGTIQQQLNKYSKVVEVLRAKNLYDKSYDYLFMGFRNAPHHYWLSRTALRLLTNAKEIR